MKFKGGGGGGGVHSIILGNNYFNDFVMNFSRILISPHFYPNEKIKMI